MARPGANKALAGHRRARRKPLYEHRGRGQGFLPPGYPGIRTRGTGASASGHRRATAPRRTAGGRRGTSRLLVSLVAGITGALLVLLLMPAIFGVNPVDLVTGRLREAVPPRDVAGGGTGRVVVSPSRGGLSVTAIAEKVVPSIVNIDVRGASGSFFDSGQEETGSGVIYTEDGYIITNNHVVAEAREITVTLADGESVPGRKVGADDKNDIAVIKIDRTGLPAAELGDSGDVAVGGLAVAVGSPFGFERTVTAGIVSALDRSVTEVGGAGGAGRSLTGLIQTDASINPGNSGGALCDGEGKVIGINTAIATAAGGSEGIGFAVPINRVKAVAGRLSARFDVDHGEVAGHEGSGSLSEQVRQQQADRGADRARLAGSRAGS